MNKRHLPIGSPRVIAAVICASILAGCLRERHLVGEDLGDATVGVPDTGTAGVIGSDANGPGAGGSGGGGSGSDASPTTPDGAADGGTAVVPLGGQSSGGWPIAISPEEVARRLSSFVLQKPPSPALTAAVVAAAPRTNEDVGQLTDGLLLDEASLDGRHAFYRWWLGLDTFALAQRDATLFPAFTPAVASALVDQVLMFAEDVTWRPGGDLTTLLTEPAAFVTTATAAWFPGVRATAGAAATRVALDPTYYAGLFTQPAVVATADYVSRAEPSGRGMKVWDRYSCQPIPAEPANVPVPAIPMGMTIRQWDEEANFSQTMCVPCHKLIDPPGFAFGHFDAVGAFQDTEGGLPVDTSGVLTAWNGIPGGADLSFTGAADLADQLAALPIVRACFAAKWLAFSTGKYATSPADSVAVSGAGLTADADYVVKRATIQGRLNLRGTIRAVTETHTFLDP